MSQLRQLHATPRSQPGSPVQQLGWHMFDFQRQLGRGSSGTAELVRRKSDGMLLVMKVIQVGEEEQDDSMNNEVKILTKLQHPHIIGYYGSFMNGSWLHILMDYADGGTLEDVVKQSQKKGQQLTKEEVMAWTCQLVLALRYTHSQRVLHRDLKQANVFLVGRWYVKLGDFGLARALSSEQELAATACGTPYYLSPELCLGKPYDQKSDCWALGCLIYELMTLKRPFQGKNLHDVVLKICKGECSPVPEEWGNPLISLVVSLLQKEPADRPSMAEVAELQFVKDFTQTKLPEMLKKEDARRKRSMRRPHRRTASDVPLGSWHNATTTQQQHISTPVNTSSEGQPQPRPLTPLPPKSSPAQSPVPEKITSLFGAMKDTLNSPKSANKNHTSSPRHNLQQLMPPPNRVAMSPIQIHPLTKPQSPVPSMNEIDKTPAVAFTASSGADGFGAAGQVSDLQALDGLDHFVSARQVGSLVGIDRGLLANFPPVPAVAGDEIGQDKLQLEALARVGHAHVAIEDRGNILQRYKRCCSGADLVRWMLEHFQIDDPTRVLPICHQLLARKVLQHCNGESTEFVDSAEAFYRFQEDVTEPCLNLKRIWDVQPARDAHAVACSLQEHLQMVYELYVSPDGRRVNYDGIRQSEEFYQLELMLAELQVVELSILSFREKLGFWINLYNIMCIHMIVSKGPPDSKIKRWSMQGSIQYTIQGQCYSLADVKHGILRGNQRTGFSLFRQFGDGDLRREQSLPIFDPRVHFALVEGATSSPRLFLYHTNSEIEKELTNSAQLFCQDLVVFDVKQRKVMLPEVLKDYLEDFQCSETELVCNHLSSYCVGGQAEQCAGLLAQGNFSVEYISKDWELNSWET